MAYPEYDPNEPTLRQAIADLLRGMTNKQSYQEIGQGVQNVAKIIPSVVESVGRGGLAQTVGAMGDAREMRDSIQSKLPKNIQNISNIAEFMASPTSKVMQQIAPTSQQTLNAMPRINPDYEGSQQHEMVGGLISPAMPYLLRAGAKSMQNVPIGNMIAYHGTPHEIQGAFDLKKVGTGEGAQAYGHGMYFAESPKVAETYALEVPKNISKDAYSAENIAKRLFNGGFDENYVTNRIKSVLPNANDEIITKAIENAKTGKVGGNLYKVDIPDAYIPTMMDYDKPLGQQNTIVKKALNEIKKQITPEMKMELGGDMNLLFGKDITPVQFLNTMEIIHPTGGVGIGEKMLNELGVKGMRYLDATSRDAGKGTSNFVVFDPKEVKILEKNGKPTRKDILEQNFNKIAGGEKPVRSAVVLIGDKIFTGNTHTQAFEKAIHEGVVRKEGKKFIYPEGAEVNSDLFMLNDGSIVDRLTASRKLDVGSSEGALRDNKMQIRPANSMPIDEYMRQAKIIKESQK